MPEPRIDQAVNAARSILEHEGWDAVSMRRIADRVGIKAPSLYKHLRDKREVETALTTAGMTELNAALAAAGPDLRALADAYRTYAISHPHLYQLMMSRPLDRSRIPRDIESGGARPLLAVVGNQDRARAVWAAAHGLAVLEIADRFPPGADINAAWTALIDAFADRAT